MAEVTRKSSRGGICRYCEKRRDVYSIRRSGGGTYRRGGRSYSSSICGECATCLLANAPVHAGASADRFDVYGLRLIVASIATYGDDSSSNTAREAAGQALASYETRRSGREADRDLRRAEWQYRVSDVTMPPDTAKRRHDDHDHRRRLTRDRADLCLGSASRRRAVPCRLHHLLRHRGPALVAPVARSTSSPRSSGPEICRSTSSSPSRPVETALLRRRRLDERLD